MTMNSRKRAAVVSFLIFLGIIGVLKAIDGSEDIKKAEVVSFIVVGGTGDLAKRKIWPSVAEMVIKEGIDLSLVHFYAGTRDSTEATYQLLHTFFSEQECAEQWNINIQQCKAINDKLLNSITCVRLKNSDDYTHLNKQIEGRVDDIDGKERLRIFYLAVPPFAYSEIARNVHMHCRSGSGDLRIAIEKPFGRDLASAETLASDLRNYLIDDEVYLVDHYLHKNGVKLIHQFLMYNSELLKPIWNKRYIEYVEIVARERVTVKGRSSYYNHYGVIRDMLQSHLTELMTIITTNVETNIIKEGENKLKNLVLQKITHPFVDSSFIGQYNGYQTHVMEDSGSLNITRTPTFASVVLYIQDIDWHGLPFFLSSGKSLLKREGYVRIVFKDNAFKAFTNEKCIPEMTFTFNTDLGENNFITISPSIPDLKKDFEQSTNKEGSCSSQVLTPNSAVVPLHSYSSVISGLINGDKHFFIPLNNIIQSWKIWTPLLKELESDKSSNIHIYNADIVNKLQLIAKGTKLVNSFKDNNIFLDSGIDNSKLSVSSTGVDGSIIVSIIAGHPVNLASRSPLLRQLASDIYSAALKSVASKGTFHLALPGGSSPLELFQILSLDYKESLPWKSTHIWQTDERCVDTSSPDSNMNQLKRYLLDFVDIPSSNIHPMLPNGKTKMICFNESNNNYLCC